MIKILSLALTVIMCMGLAGCSDKLSDDEIEKAKEQIETVYESNGMMKILAGTMIARCEKYEDETPLKGIGVDLLYDDIEYMSESFSDYLKNIESLDIDLIYKYLNIYETDENKGKFLNSLTHIYRSVAYTKGICEILQDNTITSDELSDATTIYTFIKYPIYQYSEYYDGELIRLRNEYDIKYGFTPVSK